MNNRNNTYLTKSEESRLRLLEKNSHEYLEQLQDSALKWSWRGWIPRALGRSKYSLWAWQTRVPLAHRWSLILQQCEELRTFLIQSDSWEKARCMNVLDLGCGFGMYWPILREYGFRKFVGIDLFDMRGRQQYFKAARKYIGKFCSDCETQLIMDDVRNLDKHKLLADKFDIILNIATTSTKLRSTGIPHDILESVGKKHGAENCLIVDVAKAH
ncbi:MAG: class I SAM-dependent methyltransferase [bacterium]|nr:class I SAM-dependent methyltransferase [bacterium]